MALVALVGCSAVAGGTPSAPQPSSTPSISATPSTTPSTTPTSTTTPSTGPGTLQPGAVPLIEGTPRYRSVLSFDEPEWGPGKVRLVYQWRRDGAPISGATGTSYRATADDIGHLISVRITGTAPGYGRTRQETEAVGPVAPGRLSPRTPTISGTATVGNTLTGDVDPWGPGDVRLSWQWLRDGTAIAKATERTYRLGGDDRAHAITVRVTGRATNFADASRESEPTRAVAAGTLDPTPVPLYSGTAQVGHVLTALPREWGPGTVALTYQWYRSGKDEDTKIEGATKARYRLVAADEGHRLRVRVSGTKAGYTTVRQYSGWTSVVEPGDLDGSVPTITGAAVQGRTLTAKPGEWGPDGVELSYRWYRSGLLITRAEGETYTLSGADVGHTITVRVRGEKDGYRDLVHESAPTDVVVTRER